MTLDKSFYGVLPDFDLVFFARLFTKGQQQYAEETLGLHETFWPWAWMRNHYGCGGDARTPGTLHSPRAPTRGPVP